MSKIDRSIKGLQLETFAAEEAADAQAAYETWRDDAVAANVDRKILAIEVTAKLDEYAMFVFYTE